MRLLVIALMLLLAPSPKPTAPSIHFQDIAQKSGVTTVSPSSPDKRYLVETMGGGVALFDCDNDGKLDIACSQ